MKVQELIGKINNGDCSLENELDVKKYLPLEVKKTIAQSIIFECVGNEFGATNVDSVQKYIAYVRHMITAHTDLEYVDDDYDILCSTKYKDGILLDAIFDCFDRDADEFEMILDFMVDDYMQELSLDATIVKFVNELSANIQGFADKIGNFDFEKFIPKDLDVNKLNGFLNKYMK